MILQFWTWLWGIFGYEYVWLVQFDGELSGSFVYNIGQNRVAYVNGYFPVFILDNGKTRGKSYIHGWLK